MKCSTPEDLIAQVVAGRNGGDVESVVKLYEPNATIIPQPGMVRRGSAALRDWLASYVALQPIFVVLNREILDADGVALHCAQWTLSGVNADGTSLELAGRTADLLRRQPDGGWLVAVDNPWGTAILDSSIQVDESRNIRASLCIERSL